MAWGVSSVMGMGVSALFASQANIQVTGNNISNVNTPGYSRQAVVLDERYAVNYYPGQVGQGVETKEIIRYFDKYIESGYLSKLTTASRFTTQYTQLRTVENLFNESNIDGIGSFTNSFLKAWNELITSGADSQAAREALLSKAGILTGAISGMDNSLREIEDQINTMIAQEVDSANKLMKEIAALNREIAASYVAGRNNPNQLMDARDSKVRELAAIIDIDVSDNGPGHYSVSMKNGTTLIQNDIPFSLEFRGASAENNLTANSQYKLDLPSPPGTGTRYDAGGNIINKTAHFNGQDSHEYTIEMVTSYLDTSVDPPVQVTGADTIGGTPPAKFRVSIDGGKTWMTNDDGSVKLFNAQTEDMAVTVGDLDIWFDAGQVSAGDRIVISPKSDVYWISPTSGPMNITTQIFNDGTDNTNRITGGTLAGLLEFRDHNIGEYRDRLDAFARSLIWEVNRIHSQGAGLEAMSSVLGTYQVPNINVPLGSQESRLTWADKLQSGNLTFAIYDSEGNPVVADGAGLDVLSMLPGGNFDPSKHSLTDVMNAINDPANPASQYMTASIVDGRLQISAKTDAQGNMYSFAMSSDTTGLAAALGINTFFTGDSAGSIGVNSELTANKNLINAGRLDGQGQFNPGGTQTARELGLLSSKKVSIGTVWNKNTSQTLSEYYGTLVTRVGSDTQSTKFVASSESAMAQDLYQRQEEISGVNLDEEMTNLIKFQASYKAAAKLITTADEMLQTLLSLKQ